MIYAYSKRKFLEQ